MNCFQGGPSDHGAQRLAEQSTAAPPADVFDLNAALGCCFDQQIFLAMAEFFFLESAELIEQMHAAIGKEEASGLARAAHRLRGTVLYLGAALCLDAAQRVEQAGISDDLTAAAAAMGDLELQVDLLKQALGPYRPGAKA